MLVYFTRLLNFFSSYVESCFKSLLYSLFLVFTSEPSAPPLNVRGHNISSASILVVWGEVPTAYRNGIITSYNITYYSQTENHSNSTRVDHPVRQVTLPGLKEFVNYSITVLASTVKGNGPKSDPIIVSTGEDGELFCFRFEVRRCISETQRLLIINIHLDSLKIEWNVARHLLRCISIFVHVFFLILNI